MLKVASVASFFISRIGLRGQRRLPEPLGNRLGVASAQLAYAAYQQLLATGPWQRLADASEDFCRSWNTGARPQRLLWANTSTKDRPLSETFYVRRLAAPGTVNTIPESTLLAFARSGAVDDPLRADGGDAQAVDAARADVTGQDAVR